MRTLAIGLFVACLCPAPAAAQAVHLLIVVGLAGEPEHGEAFRKWGSALADSAERLGVARSRLVYLADRFPADDGRVSGQATRAGIEQALKELAQTARADDVVMVVLIGHGSFDGREAKFNLPGPDLAPADLDAPLRRLPASRVVVVNTASASGPFVEALSSQNRTIITATRSGAERFATLFGGFFVDALASESADADKNRRVSLREAFDHATREVSRAYEREGLMATEHARIDDPANVAGVLALGTVDRVASLPADPRLRALHEERRDLERRVEALALLKGSMDSTKYLTELERLATAIAQKTREIRAAEQKQ